MDFGEVALLAVRLGGVVWTVMVWNPVVISW